MKKVLSPVILLFLCCHLSINASATDKSRDGKWWLEQTANNKMNYTEIWIEGLLMGRDIAFRAVHSTFSQADSDSQSKIIIAYEKDEVDFQNLTPSRLVEWLDGFYKESRNHAITVDKAIWIKLNQMTGKSDAEIDKMIESYRAGV